MTDISDRTFELRVIRQIRISPSGQPSTTSLARGLQIKPDTLRQQLVDLARRGVIVERDGGWGLA